MANAFQQIGGILGDIATTAVSPPDGTAYAEGLREGYSAARAMEDAARARNLRIVSDQRVAARNRLVQPTPVDGEPGLPGQGVLGDVYGPAADLASAVLLSGDTVDLRRLGPLATPGSLEAARQEWFAAGTEQAIFAIDSGAASAYGISARGQNDSKAIAARITSPASGTVIALDPDIPPTRQRLQFTATRDAVQWRLDGKPLGRGARVPWLPWPGRHVVQITDARGTVLDEVRLEVRGAGVVAAPTRAGAH